jgi:hypothetical protein
MDNKDSEELEKTKQQYEYEREQIDKMFPNALFDIAIELEELDEVVTEETSIVVKNTYSCYCYDDCKKNTDFFHITCNPCEKMTNKFIIQELINQNLNLQECNHRFLEGFIKSKNSDCQLEIVVGS